ncbi:MAG: LysM peptidoglycan-binding domain-containing protein [Saprospiraceae bacterium]
MRILSLVLTALLFISFSNISNAQENALKHTVAVKENLNQIAKQYDVSVTNLKKVNKLKGDKILNGQVLEIPRKDVHIVSGGETLYEIGQKYNLTAKELKSWNKLTSNRIRSGQELNLKSKTVGAPKNIPTSSEFTAKGGTVYTSKHVVNTKENLFRIADRYDLTVGQIKATNKLTSDDISIGQELILPLQSHTVAKNETLSHIAKKYKVSVADLKKVNNLKSNMIRRGKELLIPGK